jgi:hypothetical protein
MGLRTTAWRVSRLAAGSLLLVAGGLKFSSADAALSPSLLLSDRHVQFALAGFEVGLAVWLLTGWSAAVGRWLAVVTFAGFAAASGYLGWLGVSRCGCFGDLPVSPWAVFAADVVLAGGLLLARPPHPRPGDWTPAEFAVPAG